VNDKSYLDLIFESRNKDYGAFALRNLYNKNLSVALLSSVIGFLTLSLINQYVEKQPVRTNKYLRRASPKANRIGLDGC